ncbi:MAG: glycosyltransferase family 2 protein [Actinomycetota bacterium]|nr:glycosyltransferase family 2 protein [Actinomycetota bacterium]
MNLAVITIASGRHDHLRLQLKGLASSTSQVDQHVVVAMDDPHIARVCPPTTAVIAVDRDGGRLPLAAARNAGARHAIALGADVLIFLDVDCVPSPHLIASYEAVAADHPHALLSGPVAYLPPPSNGGYDLDTLRRSAEPHPDRPALASDEIRELDHTLFWSLSFAVHAGSWTRIGGFYPAYTGYGAEDTDFAQVARSRGIPHLILGGAMAYHQWHPTSDPPLQHLDDILRNGRIYRDRWGRWPMPGWLARFAELGLITRDAGADDWVRVAGRHHAGGVVRRCPP